MSETTEFESLSALAGATNASEKAQRRPSVASVRVSPGPYLTVVSVATFLSALLLRSHHDVSALALIAAAWIVTPLLALTDRVVFDGSSLWRQGAVSYFLNLISGRRKRLSVDDFEMVETNAVRTLRRGGSVRYRYRTEISGRGRQFVIASGAEGIVG